MSYDTVSIGLDDLVRDQAEDRDPLGNVDLLLFTEIQAAVSRRSLDIDRARSFIEKATKEIDTMRQLAAEIAERSSIEVALQSPALATGTN